MVRLEGFSFFASQRTKNLFQFLMVRLEGVELCVLNNSDDISIPYGSIRGEIQKIGNRTLDLISIPYGSIRGKKNYFFPYRLQYFNSLWFD